MLSVTIDEASGVALFEPNGPLSERDFESAVKIIDPWIEKNGSLRGLTIHVESFPGWESFGALCSHLRFVKDHHMEIGRVAFATDSPIGTVAEKFAGHFVSAEIRMFPYESLDQAKSWASGGS